MISKLNARPTHPPSTVFLIEFEPEARPHLTTRHFSARLHRANDIYSLSPSLHSHFPTYNLSLPADCPSLCFASLSLPSLASVRRRCPPFFSPLLPTPLPGPSSTALLEARALFRDIRVFRVPWLRETKGQQWAPDEISNRIFLLCVTVSLSLLLFLSFFLPTVFFPLCLSPSIHLLIVF